MHPTHWLIPHSIAAALARSVSSICWGSGNAPAALVDLEATGDAPPPAPWSVGTKEQGGKIYFATKQGGGQVTTANRLDAINAAKYVEEHPGTSIEDALVTVITQRVALDGLKVVGARVGIDAPHAIDATLSP